MSQFLDGEDLRQKLTDHVFVQEAVGLLGVSNGTSTSSSCSSQVKGGHQYLPTPSPDISEDRIPGRSLQEPFCKGLWNCNSSPIPEYNRQRDVTYDPPDPGSSPTR